MHHRRTSLAAAALVAAAASGLTAQDLPVRAWLLRGPIHADSGVAGLLRDYVGGETRLLPDSGDVIAGGAFLPANADSLGRVNLVALLRSGTDGAVAYAHAYLMAPTERTLQLVMDSDDDLVAFVNGQRIWVNPVARGVGVGRDTVTVRFAAGWNSVLLKVVNRTGGFDLLGRVAAIPGVGSLDGVRIEARRPAAVTAHNHPAATATVSPLRLDGPLTWNGAALEAAASATVTAWGRDTLRGVAVRFRQGQSAWAGDSVGALAPGVPTTVRMRCTFDEIRTAALGTSPLVATATWEARGADGRPAPVTREMPVAVDAGRLLELAGARLALGSWLSDSAAGRRLQTTLVVPRSLHLQRLDLLAPEFGPRATYLVGASPRPWREGAVELCGPCRAGDTLRLAIALEPGRPWWSFPAVRARDPGDAD